MIVDSWYRALFFALLLPAAACSSHIGDSCTTNVNCSPQGNRFCDIASPNGYCTIDSCDYGTCPDNANCIAFFTLNMDSGACTPNLVADASCDSQSDATKLCCLPGTPGCCNIGERCLCYDQACQTAYCASNASEHRWCMASCSSNSDCRTDAAYQCYTTGTNGSEAIPYRDQNNNLLNGTNPSDPTTYLPPLNFCAPSPLAAP